MIESCDQSYLDNIAKLRINLYQMLSIIINEIYTGFRELKDVQAELQEKEIELDSQKMVCIFYLSSYLYSFYHHLYNISAAMHYTNTRQRKPD